MNHISFSLHRDGPWADARTSTGWGRWPGLPVWAGAGALVALACLLAPASQRGLVLSSLWVAPWLEELFFRACLQESLLRRWADVGPAHARRQGIVNVGVALLFGCAHAVARDFWTGVAVVLPALGFGLLYQKARRVAPVAVLHGLCNVPWLFMQLRPLT